MWGKCVIRKIGNKFQNKLDKYPEVMNLNILNYKPKEILCRNSDV